MELILLVEDDEKIAANIVLRLREAGYGVVAFRSAEDARVYLRDIGNVQPDMLLVDVRLPGMSGIELIRRLGTDVPPAIIISGEASMAETVEAIRLGVHDFIDKPFSRERLVKAVQNCLETVALKRQLQALRTSGQQILGSSAAAKDMRYAVENV